MIRIGLIKHTAGEYTHQQMRHTARGESTWYKRLDVDSSLQSLPLDHWESGQWLNPITGQTGTVPGGATLTLIEEQTKMYLSRGFNPEYDDYAEPKIKLTQMAEKLVRQRRRREGLARQGVATKRWDTYVGKYLRGYYRDNPDGPLRTNETGS